MIALRKAAGLVTQGGVFLRKAAGLVQQEVYLRTAAGLKLIHTPESSIDLDISGDAYGATATDFGVAVTTSSVTVSATGGAAPYSYTCQRNDDPMATDWSILSPNAATTAFRKTIVAPGDYETATFSFTVTDANGNAATSDVIAAVVTNYGGLGGPLP